ncbi:hypothetical protein ACFL3Q_12065 [Planctomycetota bacterium]
MSESGGFLVLKQLTDTLDGYKIDYASGGSISSLHVLGEALWRLKRKQMLHERFMLIGYA